MVKIKVGKKEIYYSITLKNNLAIGKKYVEKDWDMVNVVSGEEGVGKSVLAQQIGAFWDPNLNIDSIVFSAEEFKTAVFKAKKKQCIIFDEAHGSLSSRGAMSKINKTLVSLMAEIRQKQLFIIMVLPSFWELDRYIAIFRSRFLIECYSHGFQRGYFKFYSAEKKKKLYMKGKKYYENWIKPDFVGRFCKGYYVNEEAYRKKKLESMRKSFEEKTPTTPIKRHRDILIKYLIDQGVKQHEIAKLIGLKRISITAINRDMNENSEKQKSIFSNTATTDN